MNETDKMPFELPYYWVTSGVPTIDWWVDPEAWFGHRFSKYFLFNDLTTDGSNTKMEELKPIIAILDPLEECKVHCHYNVLHDIHDRGSFEPKNRSYFGDIKELPILATYYGGTVPEYMIEEEEAWCLVVLYDSPDVIIACQSDVANRLSNAKNIEFQQLPLNS